MKSLASVKPLETLNALLSYAVTFFPLKKRNNQNVLIRGLEYMHATDEYKFQINTKVLTANSFICGFKRERDRHLHGTMQVFTLPKQMNIPYYTSSEVSQSKSQKF